MKSNSPSAPSGTRTYIGSNPAGVWANASEGGNMIRLFPQSLWFTVRPPDEVGVVGLPGVGAVGGPHDHLAGPHVDAADHPAGLDHVALGDRIDALPLEVHH